MKTSNAQWVRVDGILVRGHQVASGIAPDSPYPQGTIVMQRPFFQQLGLDLSSFYPGTLNISLSPYQFKVKKPAYTFRNLRWNSEYPAEDFSFANCRVIFQNIPYQGLVYYPHPETKIGHFQDNSTLEILAPPIPDIRYGDKLEVEVSNQEITLLRVD